MKDLDSNLNSPVRFMRVGVCRSVYLAIASGYHLVYKGFDLSVA